MIEASAIRTDGVMDRWITAGNKFNTRLLQRSPSLVVWQSQCINDPLEIVRPVVLDLDSTALFSVVNRDVGSQMLLQAVLQILHCRSGSARIASGAARFAPSATNAEQAGNHPLRRAHRRIATQNSFRSEQLFFRRFQRQQHLRMAD